MALKPDLLKWVSSNDAAKITDPGASKKLTGFLYKERPPFQYFNYLFNAAWKWFLGLQGSYYQVVVGSSAQVTSSDATHTIAQLTDLVVPAGTRVLFLEGTHALTGALTLTSANIVVEMENGAAVINLATFKLSLSGAGVRTFLRVINPNGAADSVSIAGVNSMAWVAGLNINQLTIGTTGYGVAGGGVQFTGSVSWKKGTNVASAAALTPAADGNLFHVTGTTTITSIAAGAPSPLKLVFDGSLILTHNATTLILPGGINRLTAAGDSAEFFQDGAGNWRCLSFVPASGLGVVVIDRKTATVTVANTVTQTDVYRYTVPGNTLGLDKKLRLTIIMDVLYNNNVADQFEINVAYGATNIYVKNIAGFLITAQALNAARHRVKIFAELSAKGATNAQIGDVWGEASDPVTDGLETIRRTFTSGLHTAVAEDSTVNKDLFAQVKWSAASVNNSCRMLGAILESL